MSMSFVRAISRGARTMPAMPAAVTETANDDIGDGEDSTSIPPREELSEVAKKLRPGSGRAKNAEKNDRTNEVMVDSKIECM